MSIYQYSEANEDTGVTITRAGTLAPVNYPGYPPELGSHEYKASEEDVFCNAPTASTLPAGYRPSNQLDYFRKLIKAYNDYDSDAVKYVKKVKALIDKRLDEIKLGHVRLAHLDYLLTYC